MTPGEPGPTTQGRLLLEGVWRRVRLLVIQPADYPHTGAFAELIDSLFHAFKALGAVADIAENEPLAGEGVNIVFGAHLLPFVPRLPNLPHNSVIFNLEQLKHGAFQERSAYARLLRSFPIWDYSQRNVALCQAIAGHQNVHLLRLGYMPQMTRIPSSPGKDIDVIFYGTVNDRRRAILESLTRSGLNVETLTGVYGEARDAFIARAKIVLNIHFYDDKIHELTRTSYLLANRKLVVSECDDETEIEDDIKSAIIAATYDRLVPTCVALVQADPERAALEERGFGIFSRRDQVDYLLSAISATSIPVPPMRDIGAASLGTSMTSVSNFLSGEPPS
jgi:hypothetical protein